MQLREIAVVVVVALLLQYQGKNESERGRWERREAFRYSQL